MSSRRFSRLCARIGRLCVCLPLASLPVYGAFAQPAPGTRRALTLREVITAAQAVHPTIYAARARARAARGVRTTAGTFPDPVISYDVQNTRFPGGAAPPAGERESFVVATVPLAPLFQRWPRVRQGDATVRAADADALASERQVALDAARAFFRVAIAQLALRASLELRDGLEELARYNATRVSEGLTAEADLIRVRIERDRAAAAATIARVDLLRGRAELAALLGRPASSVTGDELTVAIERDDSLGTAGPLAQYAARASAQRPELVAARARAAAAGAETGYQRTLIVRQLGASVGTKRVAGATSMVAGVSLSLPLFDRNRGEVQRAAAERDAAEQELLLTERRILADLAAAHEAARLLSEQVAALGPDFLARAEESRDIAVAAYQDGATPLLQVIDASRTLAEARLTYFRTVFARRESLIELNVMSGADPLGGQP